MPDLGPEDLLQQHRLYDQYVDVVCAFEWLFTETKSMPETVRHFERFPRLDGDDGNPATPDFSVLFSDGTGMVGEIARIALHEASVDDLCRQVGRYDRLTSLQDADGRLVEVEHVDVLLLVPLDIGTDVVRRVIRERLSNENHGYNPTHPPCIVQYVVEPDKYVFQRRPDEGNGHLRDGGRSPGLGSWLSRSDFKPPAAGFAHVKAQRPFMNDSVAPLYLACQLWTKVVPTLTADTTSVGGYKPLVISADELSDKIGAMYGRVGKTALRKAMAILVAARCADELSVDRWQVAWGDLAHRGGEEIGDVLARRTQKPPARGPIRRLAEAYADLGLADPARQTTPEPGRLF